VAEAAGGGARFACVQNELNLLDRADVDDALAEVGRLGIAYLPYYPLANGMLTGKYRRGTPAPEGSRLDTWFDERERQEALTMERFDRLEAIETFAANHGHTPLELAFGWLLSHGPVASVIAGATSAEQVTMNAAAGGWILDAADLDAMP